MPTFDADLPVDACFEAFGVAAIYRPSDDSGDIPCIVVQSDPDAAIGGPANTRAFARARMIEVRRSELTPTRDGKFILDDEQLKVVGDPKTEDPLRLVFTCTVVAA